MVHGENPPGPPGRVPTFDDLVALCRALNAEGARYVVIGGMAIQHYGLLRTTEDVDLLVESSVENIRRVQRALATLPDNAAALFGPEEVETYGVVRVSDEIMVDLLKSACGVSYSEAKEDVHLREVEGVAIPFASPSALLKTKQTLRSKDELDRVFLRRIIAESSP